MSRQASRKQRCGTFVGNIPTQVGGVSPAYTVLLPAYRALILRKANATIFNNIHPCVNREICVSP